jgi:serine/threonine protein kinase
MLKEESSGERLRRTEESQGEEMHGSGTLDLGDLMETSVSEEAAIHARADPGRVIKACSLCEALMDVTNQPPLSQFRCPNCGQRLRVHRRFNNYRLLEFLGEGGMGWVYRAVDRNLNREVALKILKKECRANAEEYATLEREARITASIDHPHVIKVFSFGEDQGQLYLAMELAEKGSLADLMSVQPQLAEAQELQIGIQIAKGLDAALEHNLIHRDIKPGNILFSDPDTAKLVDFGLALFMDEVAHAEPWGTVHYIAPEKVDDRDDRPEDFRCDIYSLGGTLFHALAGRPPHTGGGAITIALKQVTSQPVSLQAFAPHVSSETAYVINRMLAKNPAERYASYRELVQHLSYARNKLLERSRQPRKAKERLVVETFAMKKTNASSLASLLQQASSSPNQIKRSRLRSPASTRMKTSKPSVCYASACTTGQLGRRQTPARSSLRSSVQPCPSLKAGSTNSSQWPRTTHPIAIGSPKSKRTSAPSGCGVGPGVGQESPCGTGRTQTWGKLATRLKAIEADLIAKGAHP